MERGDPALGSAEPVHRSQCYKRISKVGGIGAQQHIGVERAISGALVKQVHRQWKDLVQRIVGRGQDAGHNAAILVRGRHRWEG